MAKKKKFYESWTFWLNLVVVIIAGLKGVVAPIGVEWWITSLGVLNLILRFKTNKPII